MQYALNPICPGPIDCLGLASMTLVHGIAALSHFQAIYQQCWETTLTEIKRPLSQSGILARQVKDQLTQQYMNSGILMYPLGLAVQIGNGPAES
jgi:hypothetical protein